MTDTDIDTAIGRVKEAFGTLTGSTRLKREAKVSVNNAVTKVAVFTDGESDSKPEQG